MLCKLAQRLGTRVGTRERTVPMGSKGEEKGTAIEARIWKEGAGQRGEAKEGGRNRASEQAV